VYRLPDKPRIGDFEALPIGNDSYDERRNGLLVLDECGTWFNSRGWQDKARQPVIDWFLHARKRGWDCIFIVQDVQLVDRQARDALCEHTAFCRRLDRVRVPIIGGLVQSLTGVRLRLPQVHTARVVYGDNEQSLMIDRWTYRGRDLYAAYDTKQVFLDRGDGVACMLSPWHVRGRYESPPVPLRRRLLNIASTGFRIVCYAVVHVVAWARGRSPRAQAKAWGLLKAPPLPG